MTTLPGVPGVGVGEGDGDGEGEGEGEGDGVGVGEDATPDVPLTVKLSILPVPPVATGDAELIAVVELSTNLMKTLGWLFKPGTPLRSRVLLEAGLKVAFQASFVIE